MTRLSRRRAIGGLAGLGASMTMVALLSSCGTYPSDSQLSKVPRVGYLAGDPGAPWATELWDALRELGWAEGKTVYVERRSVVGLGPGELSGLVAELVAVPVDVFVAVGTAVTLAARRATDTIPIVFTDVGDPVGVGAVASLARPGGNVTGISNGASTSLTGKRIELLKAIVPGLMHVAVMLDSGNPAASAVSLRDSRAAAEVLGVQVQPLDVGSENDLASAFATATGWAADAIIVPAGAVTLTQRRRVAELAERSHLPAIYVYKESVDAGGLMSYGTSNSSTHRHAATFVDKILRGAKPADLPVEQLSTVEFAINLKTAQALGLTIPPHVAAQVTEWVQ